MTREEVLAKRLALAYERIDELETENAMLQRIRPRCGGSAGNGRCGRPMLHSVERNLGGEPAADGYLHSAKPPEFYQLVEQLCIGPRLELFARQLRPGWATAGDELKSSKKKGAA